MPSAEVISYLSLGYNTVFAKLYWFETLNYFGKELEGDKDFSSLNDYCKLITNLDHSYTYYYEFCSTSLSWFAKDSEASISILTKGISYYPQNWKFYYLRGFNYWYFLKNYEQAKDDMIKSASLANAPVFVSTLAARLLTKQQGASVAIDFLKNEIKNSSDDKIRAELLSKLKQAYLAYGIEVINSALENFYNREARFPLKLEELVIRGYLINLPLEPYGGSYYISERGEVKSTSSYKPLEFSGKTSDTGMLKDEFQNK